MNREAFYQSVQGFWPDLYGEAYALYEAWPMQRGQVQSLRRATERAGHIFQKTAGLLRRLDDTTLLQMLYPKETLAFVRLLSPLPASVIARFDFVAVNGTWKVLELNADTPTFIKELYYVNGAVCRHFGRRDVNEGEEERLRQAVQTAIRTVLPPDGHVVFTAHEENIEDRLTVQYLQELYGGGRFVPLHALQIRAGHGLYDEQGRRIHVLYRQTFPVESLLLDGEIGLQLLELVEQGKLQLINPPSAFLLQNKAVMAVIWGLYEERHPFFTEEEHRWIADYFLPTYFEREPFLERKCPFVKKPVFGREGDTIELYDFLGNKIGEEKEKSYADYGFIYQQYVELPAVRAAGRDWRQLFGSFWLNGRASSIGCRAGGQITNNLSCYLPVCLDEEDRLS